MSTIGPMVTAVEVATAVGTHVVTVGMDFYTFVLSSSSKR
jgi:hypothetical protein